MTENKNLFQKLGKGKIAAIVGGLAVFLFLPELFHYFLVLALLCFPAYILLNKWLDSE